jgi:hypothetical protein
MGFWDPASLQENVSVAVLPVLAHRRVTLITPSGAEI